MGKMKRDCIGIVAVAGAFFGALMMSAPAAQAYEYDRSDCNTPGVGEDCFDYEPDPELLYRCAGAAAVGGLVTWNPKGAAAGGAGCLYYEAVN